MAQGSLAVCQIRYKAAADHDQKHYQGQGKHYSIHSHLGILASIICSSALLYYALIASTSAKTQPRRCTTLRRLPIPVRLVLAINPRQHLESPAYKPSANTIAIPAAAERVVKLTPMLAPAAGLVGVEVDDAELVLVPPATACPLRMTVMLNCVLFAHSWVGASARKVMSAHCQPR